MKDNKTERQFTTILLDVDGTLLDFDAAERDGIRAVLTHYGFEPKEEYLSHYHEMNQKAWEAFERGEVTKEKLLTERFERFFGEMGKAVNGREAEDLYRGYLNESSVLIEGALEICAYLRERYDLYIVTNGTANTQYKRLASSGIDSYVKGIFVSEEAGSQKPKKAYFDYCFSRIPGADPEKMLLVGDSLHSDIQGGINAGCATCWYNPEGKPGEDGIRADYEIRRLEELKCFL
jgi:2-haloacid dehalogenase